MNALEWADYIERKNNNAAVADLLRKQHEAIQKLREALHMYVIQDELAEGFGSGIGGETKDMAEQALKDTDGL